VLPVFPTATGRRDLETAAITGENPAMLVSDLMFDLHQFPPLDCATNRLELLLFHGVPFPDKPENLS